MKIYAIFLLCLASHYTSCCIEKYSTCGCKNSRDSKVRGKRLVCRNINVADMFANADFPEDLLISVDLSKNNNLQELSKETFGRNSHTLNILRHIKRLDFSQNAIWKIAPETFTLFPNLTRLNLSSNSIGNLSPDMFIGLPKLKMLDLSRNIFPIFPGTVLTSLTNLKKLYLKSTELICNCLMQDFATHLKESQSFLNVYGTCYLPVNLRGRSLTRLVPENMKCDANNTLDSLPHFDMIPSVPQLAFEGDTLKLHCEGTYLQTSKIVWSFNGSALDFSQTSIGLYYVNATENFDKSVITGWLKILNLSQEHTGTWNCKVTSDYGSETRTVKIMVMKRASVYCQQEKTENNKGSFLWPSTISGVTRTIECSEQQHTSGKPIFPASRTCTAGNWSVAKYDACPYADEVTERVNAILKKVLLEINIVTFLNMLTKNIIHKPLRYPMTVQLIGELMEKVVPLITDKNRDKISIPLLKLAGYVMLANESILEEAQKNTGACDKILEVVRRYALEMASSASFHKESQNIAIGGSMVLEKERYNEEGDGMNCKIIRSEENLEFACQTNVYGVQPSISFPRTLLDSCEDEDKGYKLYFIGYRNGGLFQPIQHDTNNKNSSSMTTGITSNSMVLEVGIKGCGVVNLSDPITFTFETDAPGGYYAAVWSPQGWSESDDCSALFIRKNITQVVCHNVETVALIRDPNAEICGKDAWFVTNLTHPATLVGTGVLAVCVFFVILSYMCCYNKMRMSSNYRHMLFNICVHLLLASCTFAFCIRRIDDRAVCIACGMILHYTSLAVLLWITLSVRNIHHEFVIHNRPPSLEPKPQRPMLRFYLIGCGIPIVICAITVAAKVQNYGGDVGKVEKYCWLSWETSIYAFYSPAAFIAVVCIICLIRVLCAFNRHSNELDTPRSPLVRSSWHANTRILNSSDQYQAIATEVASFRGSVPPDGITNSPLHPSASVRGTRLNDLSFKTQLCGAALSFIFYLLTWVFAALSIAAPSVYQGIDALNYVEYPCLKKSASKGASTAIEDVFAYAYAIMAVAMGIFILLQHLACRKGVRTSWQNAFSCFKSDKRYHQDKDIRTSSIRLEKSDGGEIPADRGLEYLTSFKDKISNKNHQGICTTFKTDPTMETMIHSGDAGRNGTAEESQHLQYAYHQGTLPKSCLGNGSEYQADCVPCSIQESGRPAKSITSFHSNCMVKHSEDVPNASFRGHSHRMSSSGHRHIPLSYSHDPYGGLNPRGGYVPDPHPFRHHGYHDPHLPHPQHTKPVKLTNLHMAHDSSMTEHSVDEMSHNNMHTIPVIMQHHTQLKVTNSALVDRYQKVWRALERKKAKQKRLHVLREYAQDPLTSNDEGQRDKKDSSVNEASPLLQSPELASTNGDTKGMINGSLKYRTLLLSPSNKKQDGLKSKNTGPRKRVKRLDSSGQPRPLRGDKKAKQISRISHNSTLSERERDTTASEKSRGQVDDISKMSIPSKNALSVTKHNFDSQTITVAGNDNHGYLTLQQLQSANPFLFFNQGAIMTETQNSPSAPESMLENFEKPNQRISNTSLDSSRILPHRNETSV